LTRYRESAARPLKGRKRADSASPLKRRALNSLAIERLLLASGLDYSLPGSMVYMNMAEFDPAFALHYNRDIYSNRLAHVEPIDLVRLDTATLHPGDYIVSVGGDAVEEQIPPSFAAGDPVFINAAPRIKEVSKETVIVARYGAGTWGHWLGELLPKIVMVEAAFPDRFSFAVPQTYHARGWQNFRESISAYGVPPERLVPLEPNCAYTFLRPWAVTPIWSDHVMHPAAAELMRSQIRVPPAPEGARKIALIRQRTAARVLENWDDVSALLTGKGYAMIDIARLSFSDQVRAFRDAAAVFSTLGSGLTGLIYSPIGVAVTSVAPALFGDRFFYALVVNRQGRYADVRGPILSPDPHIPHRGSFTVDPIHLAQALVAVET
jgi:Glycosyltransferase 61